MCEFPAGQTNKPEGTQDAHTQDHWPLFEIHQWFLVFTKAALTTNGIVLIWQMRSTAVCVEELLDKEQKKASNQQFKCGLVGLNRRFTKF